MPFRPWTRWRFSAAPRTPLQPGALAQEVDRLSSNPRIHRVFEWLSRHEREIADFQLAITEIPAPSFAEQSRAAWLAERLQPLGLKVTTDAVGNLLASRPGLHADNRSSVRSEAPAIAVSAHLDTVFPANIELNIRRDMARLLGPGISDNGSGLAALWAVASAFHAAEIVTDLPVLFIGNVCEEGEGNLQGMRHLYRDYLGRDATPLAKDGPAPALALLIALDGAGTDNIISEALGSRRFEIMIEGPGGHSWSEFGTPNPIVASALLIQSLFKIQLPANPRTTLNVGTIEGGTSVNTIPERVVLKVDVRSSDARRLDELEQRIRRAAAEACSETQAQSLHARLQLRHHVARVGERPAGELAATSPLLAAIRAVDHQLGIRSLPLRASTDANIPLSLGLEAVSLGAGGSGGGAHTIHEWFDPAGRELALRRIALLVLLLAGVPPEDSHPEIPTPNPSESA